MKRFIAVFLCALMLTTAAFASEDDQRAFLDLLARAAPTSNEYRIRLPERAPDAHETAEVRINDDTTITIDADVHDFGVERAICYRATPPEMDAGRLIAFFWPDADAAAVLSGGVTEDGVETYVHAGGQLRLSRATGEVSFLADMKRIDTVALRHRSSPSSNPSSLPDAPGAIVDLKDVEKWAQSFLALFGIEEAPILIGASALREEYPDGALDVEIFCCAIVRDGLPFSTLPYNSDPEGVRVIPAQQLTMAFDERGLADLRATVFHLEPIGPAEEILPYLAMLNNLKEGEGFLWWGGDALITRLTLEYMLVTAEDPEGAYTCVPAWRFKQAEQADGWWSPNAYAYDALTAAFITS